MKNEIKKFNKKELELQTKICERVRKYFEENHKDFNKDVIVERVNILALTILHLFL